MCQMSRYINCIRMLCAAHTHTKLSRSRGQHVINTEFMTWAQYWKTRRKNHQKPNAKIRFSTKILVFEKKNSKNKKTSWKQHFFTFSFSYLILYFSSSRFAFWSNSRYLIFAWADSRSRSKSRLFRWRSSISAFWGYFGSNLGDIQWFWNLMCLH